MKSRYTLATVLAALAVVLMSAAVAWACTGSSKLNINPKEGPAGSTIEVKGSNFWGGPMRVYWEPNGSPERELLFERSSGGTFAQPATIPADAEGIGYVKAYSYKGGKDPATDEPDRTRTAVFTVSQPEDEEPQGSDGTDEPQGSQDSQPQGSQGSQPQGSQSSKPQGSEGVEPQPQGSHASQPQGSEGVGSESGRDRDSGSQGTAVGGATSQPQPGESSQPESADEAEPAPSAEESGPQTSAEDQPRQQIGTPDAGGEAATSDPPRQAVGPSEPAAPQPAEQPEPAGEQAGAAQEPAQSPSTPAPSADEGEPAAAEETAAEPDLAGEPEAGSEPEAAESEAAEAGNTGHPAVSPDADADEAVTSTEHPSARSGSADLWSGLADGDQVGLYGADQHATESSDTGQSLVLALGLLGAGLLTLATGGTVAARRRRAPAEATAKPRSG